MARDRELEQSKTTGRRCRIPLWPDLGRDAARRAKSVSWAGAWRIAIPAMGMGKCNRKGLANRTFA